MPGGSLPWTFYGDSVLAKVRTTPADVQEAFYSLLARMRGDPSSPRLGARALKAGSIQPWPPTVTGHYTVPFEHGLLTYEVLADHPAVHLLDIVLFGN
jgi:hypothetical protein